MSVIVTKYLPPHQSSRRAHQGELVAGLGLHQTGETYPEPQELISLDLDTPNLEGSL